MNKTITNITTYNIQCFNEELNIWEYVTLNAFKAIDRTIDYQQKLKKKEPKKEFRVTKKTIIEKVL